MVASVGTHAKISLDRPWQLRLTANKPAECPFEAVKLGDAVQHFPHICKTWYAIDNVRKTSSVNKLIMPNSCWTESTIQSLGGKNEIECAWKIASCLAPRLNVEGLFFLAQVGYDGGASVPWHLHWQLQTLEQEGGISETERFFEDIRREALIIGTVGTWQAVLGGKFAGQCLFLPDKPIEVSSKPSVDTLSTLISDVVDLYNRKFVSKQGLPPGFQIGFVIDANGQIVYGIYKPVLYHQWGTRDSMSDFGLRIKLPWSHEATLQHLRG